MAQEPRVRDLVTPLDAFGRIPIGAKLKDAVRAAGQAASRAVVVDDPGGRPIGVLPLRGLFEILQPRFARVSDWWVPLFWEGLLAERCAQADAISIEEVVIPLRAVAVQAEDTVMHVLYTMHKAKLDVLPVLEGDSLIGLVEAGRLFDEVARLVTARC
ncbi:MAG: hypothetical protein QMC81_00465 [Thermoanaerobacterales bacterium]|nr:hypothetical protein [Thermoanaerobacterales bacterium]